MKVYDDRAGEVKRNRQRTPSPFDPSFGFCALCWRKTEAHTTNDRIFIKKRGKFLEVERPVRSPQTLAIAKCRLEEIRAAEREKKLILYGELLFGYARGFDHRTLQDRGIESPEAAEMLVDVIEQNLIDDEWLTTKSPFVVGRKRFNGLGPQGETEIAELPKGPLKPSRKLCLEHNPRRSIEARRRYQNDMYRRDGFEEVIRDMTREWMNQCYGIHTDEDRTAIRKAAYKIVCMSTLEMVEALQAKGVVNQAEIGRRLGGLSRQAISLALARERQRKKQPS